MAGAREPPHLHPRCYDYVVMASAGGSEKAPAWLFNLRANPDVTLEVGAEPSPLWPSRTSPSEPDSSMPSRPRSCARRLPGQAERTIPIISLRRRDRRLILVSEQTVSNRYDARGGVRAYTARAGRRLRHHHGPLRQAQQ